jgi:ubiquinone/menaquinone biosynthesis C-methylase UbiE
LLTGERVVESLCDMGLWTTHVVPRVADTSLSTPEISEIRKRVCADLAGEVVEIGFGSGLNVPHYPPAVTGVEAVEPSDVGWRLGAARLAAARVPVTRAGLDGQRLPFADRSFDAALSTFTMCTIPDVTAALAELRRVLRPGGTLHFLEHGRAPEENVQRWQRRIEPFYSPLAGGCRITRPVDDLLTTAGFALERIERHYEAKAPRPFGFLYEGVARS